LAILILASAVPMFYVKYFWILS